MKNEKWVSGLKGFACVMVLIGHYAEVYTSAEVFSEHIRFMDFMMKPILQFVFDPEFWVFLFYLTSGYLLAHSSIQNIIQLSGKCVLRFIRLFVPMVFTTFFVYILDKTVGFHAKGTDVLFLNTWFQRSYPEQIQFTDIILFPIRTIHYGQNTLNPPYWVLRPMFIASLYIYILIYLKNKISKKWINGLLFCIFILYCRKVSYICSSCVVGAALYCFQDEIRSSKNDFILFLFLITAVLLYKLPANGLKTVSAAVILMLLPNSQILNRVFSSAAMQKLGNISWEVFSFHFPSVCSVGALIMISLGTKIGLAKSYLIAIAASVLFTIVLCLIYHFSFDKLFQWSYQKLKNGLQKTSDFLCTKFKVI